MRDGRLPDSSLVARRLGASPMLTCAAPAYLARHGTPAHPSDLAAHRCLYLSGVTTPGEWWYEVDGGPVTVRVDGPLRTNSVALACQSARAGLGIVFGPAFALAPSVAAGALDIHALYPSKRYMSKKLRLLIDFLAAHFARPVGTDGV